MPVILAVRRPGGNGKRQLWWRLVATSTPPAVIHFLTITVNSIAILSTVLERLLAFSSRLGVSVTLIRLSERLGVILTRGRGDQRLLDRLHRPIREPVYDV